MPTIAHEIKISASPSAVYKALTTVADLETWCAGTVRHPTGASVAQQGETIDMRFGDNKDFPWEFVHLEPDRHVGWRCVAGPDDSAGKGVAFDLAEAGDGRTRVSLEHEASLGSDPRGEVDDHRSSSLRRRHAFAARRARLFVSVFEELLGEVAVLEPVAAPPRGSAAGSLAQRFSW